MLEGRADSKPEQDGRGTRGTISEILPNVHLIRCHANVRKMQRPVGVGKYNLSFT
jgi:hypothetical protein